MFEFIRKGVGSMIAGVLLALLIASFALWGIGDPLNTIAGGDVATVGDRKISPAEFAKSFENDFMLAQQTYGESFTKELAVQVGFGTQTINKLVQLRSYDEEAKSLGLRVTDEELRDYIYAIEGFLDVDGTFRRNYFDQVAFSQGYSPKEFENMLRGEMVRGLLVKGIMDSVKAPNVVIDALNKYATEQRTAEILTIPASSMLNIGDITDEDILAFYDENNDRYMAPQYRDVSYFEISANDYLDMISISDEEALTSYEQRIDEFTKQEKRGFVQMLLDDEAAADLAYSELENGKKFDDVILDKAGETAADNEFEAQSFKDFAEIYGEDAANQIFSLALNGYSKPIASPFGSYIFKVINIEPGSTESFETVKEQIVTDLKADQTLSMLYDTTEKVEDELAAGSSINEIADALSIELKHVNNVSKTGIMSDGKVSPDLPLIVDFLLHAFENDIGDELELYEGIANKFYMLSVDNIIDSKLRPLDDVKEEVIADLSQKRREDLARKLATKITTAYEAEENSEKTLSDYLELGSSLVVNEVTVGRSNVENIVSGNIHASIFNQNIGAIEMIPAADNDGFVLVRLKSRAFGVVTTEQEKSQIIGRINSSYQADMMAVYLQYLTETLPVVINQGTLQRTLDAIATPADQPF